MTKVDIISGFLGAGKTTLIKKLLKEALEGQQTVLIENEFGEIGIDGGFLKEAGIEIREMNSGCICCSLVGDFTTSLREVLTKYQPDRVIIEPSGVGKLSDVVVAVQKAMEGQDVEMNSTVAVVDVLKCKMYMKNFGEFFNNQIESAGTVILSRTGSPKCTEKKMNEALELIRSLNPKATVITTDWESLEGTQILATMEETESMEADLLAEMIAEHEAHEHEHHHHHHDHDEECTCGHHHHDHDDEHDHEHHHHHHDDEECTCGHHHDHEDEHEHHHHHHHDGEECTCGHDHEHEHHHHHHHDGCGCGHDHDADEVFTSWGTESPKAFSRAELENILVQLTEEDDCGVILRSKGMVPSDDNTWLYFDMVPEEYEIREGKADVTGKIVVIGAQLKEDKLKALFGA